VIKNPAAFIAENTRILPAAHAPEVLLHLADDAVALWEMTEEELGRIGLPPPFWAFAWAGGQALARYILDHPALVQNRRVLDVASGSGLVAIAAMLAGAASAEAADLDPFAADAAALNAALNQVRITPTTRDALAGPTEADVILVGDLFYDRDLSPRLLAWLQAHANPARTILIGDPGRTYLPKDALEPVATYEVPVSRALEDAEVKRTRVWRLKGA
jgi:predicted nicotinamide N-methyase